MSTLNSPEEIALTEKLLKIHPHFDMAKFARSGGEANSIAIRISQSSIRKRWGCCMWISWMA